jgi:hypothetical protein
MCCEKCNCQTVEDSDFSPEDGVTSSPNTDIKTSKAPLFKKWWVWTIGGVTLVLSIIAVLSYKKDRQLYKNLLDLIVK